MGRKLQEFFLPFLAALLVCSGFGPMPLVFGCRFFCFFLGGRGFRSHRAPIIGSHGFARARLGPIIQG